MASLNIGYEPHRTISFPFTFTGDAGFGLNSTASVIDRNPIPFLDEGEYVSEVFYRVTTPLTSGDAAGTYFKIGLNVDDDDCVLNSTTGIINTLNAGATGDKPVHAYTKSIADGRELIMSTEGTNDITGGTIEIVLTITRAEPIPPIPPVIDYPED